MKTGERQTLTAAGDYQEHLINDINNMLRNTEELKN